MMKHISPQLMARIERLMETGDFSSREDVLAMAVRLLEDYEEKLARLRAELAIGEEQERRGELIDFTPERLEEIKRRAIENARLGKPIKDAVKPWDGPSK